MVGRASQNDSDAISELYNRTYNAVYRTVKSLIKDDDAALDVVQDSYVKAFRSLDQLSDAEKFPSWINQIAANKARDYLKKKRPLLFTEMENEDGEMMEFSDERIEHLPEEVLDREETARLIREILDALPEEQRAVLFMMHYEQMSVKEIAQALGCSENTVKSRLSYGRKKVKTAVEAMEKKGTKLYSLAPLPYFAWLLRNAKTYSIPVSEFYPSFEAAAGAASAGAAELIGGKAAGKTAARTAAKAGTKALSKKLAAGALAVTVAGSAGVAAVNSLRGSERENEAAHVIYEEFIDRYSTLLESDYSVIVEDQNRFWSEIDRDLRAQNPDADPSGFNNWYPEYTPGEDLQAGVPLPDTIYEPNMNKKKLLLGRTDGFDLRYAFLDADSDGVDEMFAASFFRDELQIMDVDVYTVRDGKLIRGLVDINTFSDNTAGEPENTLYEKWILVPANEGEYVNTDIITIKMGTSAFSPPIELDAPSLEWKTFFDYSGRPYS